MKEKWGVCQVTFAILIAGPSHQLHHRPLGGYHSLSWEGKGQPLEWRWAQVMSGNQENNEWKENWVWQLYHSNELCLGTCEGTRDGVITSWDRPTQLAMDIFSHFFSTFWFVLRTWVPTWSCVCIIMHLTYCVYYFHYIWHVAYQ